MHKVFGIIAVSLLAVSTAACSADNSPDESSDEQVGEAKQDSIESPTFNGTSGQFWSWDSSGVGATGSDFVTMSNTLNQYWLVYGVGYWPSYDGLLATQANINSCTSNSITFYSSYYCGAWYDWAGTNGQQTVHATAYVSNGHITQCSALAQAGNTYFSCATKWSTSTFTSPTGSVYTMALAND